jgi:hypothetical protein
VNFFPGDANGDGKVDFSDLLLLAQHYGQKAATTVSSGDFNGDGSVGFGDLLLLAQHYGQSAPAAADATVPEPGTWGLLATGSALLVRRRR